MIYETTVKVQLHHEECCSCGTIFGMTAQFRKRCLDEGGTFYCPKGHPQYFTKSNVQKLQAQLEQEKRNRQWAEHQYEEERKRGKEALASARAYKGQVTRIKNRVGNGSCPCCKRHFVNLERHMKNKHPDFNETK